MIDTIFALATPPGRGALAVVRASGPAAHAGLEALTRRAPPAPRRAALRTLIDPSSGRAIDDALVLAFKGPGSFTGEDIVEYHVHGGRAVVQALLRALAQQKGHRLAQPGEFTRRAFENGRLDLTAAEAVADLIDAETELQQAQALDQLHGSLRDVYEGWRARLVCILAYAEADLDFPDEDLPGGITARLGPDIAALSADIAAHLDDARRGERLRDGFTVVILGPPNAGKSTLLNALARREAAIVSPHAGTTRDLIEVPLDLAGYPVVLVDTAGLRDHSADPVEREGIARARARSESADLTLRLIPADDPQAGYDVAHQNNNKALIILSKIDSVTRVPPLQGAIPVSAHTGAGLPELLRSISDRLASLFPPAQGAALTRARHRDALIRVQDHLTRAQGAASPELAAEDLRLAARALGSITGRVDVEDLLDRIFRDFCIGK